MKAWKGEVRPERPVPFGRADAERIGLAVGKKIIYEVYTKKTREVAEERLSLRKTGRIWAVWKHGFVVQWDIGGWKECFPFYMLNWLRSTELTREKVCIKK